MEPVKRSEVLDIVQYEKIRPRLRAELLALRERRRVLVGPHFNFVFENRITVLYQIQEMVRVERIVAEEAIAHEIGTYNELIPTPGGLSASLLIEFADQESREENLPRLTGLEDHVWLVVGDLQPLKAQFDRRQIGELRLSAVQYLSFSLEARHRERWQECGGKKAMLLRVDHPHYAHETALPPETVSALAEDFA